MATWDAASRTWHMTAAELAAFTAAADATLAAPTMVFVDGRHCGVGQAPTAAYWSRRDEVEIATVAGRLMREDASLARSRRLREELRREREFA